MIKSIERMIKKLDLIYLLYLRVKNKTRKINKQNSFLLLSKFILEKNYKISSNFLFEFVNLRISPNIVNEPVKKYNNEIFKNYSKNSNIIKIVITENSNNLISKNYLENRVIYLQISTKVLVNRYFK